MKFTIEEVEILLDGATQSSTVKTLLTTNHVGIINFLMKEIKVRDKALEIMIRDYKNSYSFVEEVIIAARKELQ